MHFSSTSCEGIVPHLHVRVLEWWVHNSWAFAIPKPKRCLICLTRERAVNHNIVRLRSVGNSEMADIMHIETYQ